MTKSLNELASDLRAYLMELQSDAHNKTNFRPERYYNLMLKINVALDPNPHVQIHIAMASAEFDLNTGEKLQGSLGPDEKYVIRWLDKPNVLPSLKVCWDNAVKNRGRIVDKY